MKRLSIALVGDFNENKHTHVALDHAIDHCRLHVNFELEATWIATDSIPADLHKHVDGLWIAPGSPYKNDEAVYTLIRWARENNFPILGTCGGFQYMVVEYARNVLGFTDAGHEESEPGVEQLVISKLSCSMKGKQEAVYIDRGSWLYQVLQADKITGHFNCNYGVNALHQAELNQLPLAFTAFSSSGEVRGLEINNHPFFKGTLFQPPLASTPENPNPLILSFFEVCFALKQQALAV